jgi:hypothetical protein
MCTGIKPSLCYRLCDGKGVVLLYFETFIVNELSKQLQVDDSVKK